MGTVADASSSTTTVTMDGDYSIVANFKLILPGDVNRDGKVDMLDIAAVVACFDTAPPMDPATDINGDNAVNIFDLAVAGMNFGRVAQAP